MLNKDALQLILDQALAASGKELGTDTPVALVPQSTQVVNLEEYMPGRSRFRGALSTASLEDFCGYVLQREVAGTQGYVDQDAMSCKVFFNLGDLDHPGHADDTANLKLKPTAAYKTLLAIAGSTLTQKDLAEWMEDWAQFLTATDGEASMGLVQAIAAVRNITIKAASERTHQEGNFNASRSAMDRIEAESQDKLPDALHFALVPYEGLGQRTFTLRLSILTGGDKPALKARWAGEEIQREEIAQEFKRVLSDKLGESATLYLGSFNPGN
ncbi:DUF2303 family protein [Pseudomonas sp. LFM046]|uniref:DUF2303 family protein n=1 Tax=Pseudomonas sp. LFM046 TaxID=1608357 RepID=UPI0005CFB716|nr:DUF2303 family protein [Pseudomonas sp. LFM046]